MATNAQAVKDAGETQTTVAQCLTGLKEFYAKAGEATILMQQPTPDISGSPIQGNAVRELRCGWDAAGDRL